MLRKRRTKNTGASGSDLEPSRCEWIQYLACGQLIDSSAAPSKGEEVAKVLLDIAKESSDGFPFLKSALGCVTALIKHYEVFVEWMDAARNLYARRNSKMSGRRLRILSSCWRGSNNTSPRRRLTETKRRSSDAQSCPGILAGRWLPRTTVNGFLSALEGIEQRLQELLAKGTATRSWIRRRIPKRWRDSSNKSERLLSTTK